MKSIVKTVYILCSMVFLAYLSLPNPQFPEPPGGSLQSTEPGDTETTLRRAYFTDLTREEVLEHYEKRFKLRILGAKIPNYRLNYPPEEAQSLIRDQTRSTFLEEIVHPFRESLFINGFKPSLDKDRIFIEDKVWEQKINVKYVPSSVIPRLIIGILTISIIPFIYKSWRITLERIEKLINKAKK